MSETRHKDGNWTIPNPPTWDGAQTAVLMDIRDELKKLNALLACDNFTRIPWTLREIRDDARLSRGHLCRCGRTFLTSRGRGSHIARATEGEHVAVLRR